MKKQINFIISLNEIKYESRVVVFFQSVEVFCLEHIIEKQIFRIKRESVKQNDIFVDVFIVFEYQ